MSWKVSLQKDVIRGRWLDGWGLWLYHEFYYVVARRNGESYVHFRLFRDDWERANKFFVKVLAREDFSPENKPGIWIKVIDDRPVVQPNKTYRAILKRACERIR